VVRLNLTRYNEVFSLVEQILIRQMKCLSRNPRVVFVFMRRASISRFRGVALAAIATLFAIAVACTGNSGQPNGDAPSQRQISANTSRRDLSQDEAAGGHTLRKHIGRNDDELRERLRRERDISAASSWNDRNSAELAVGTAIAQQNEKISRWLQREDSHSNLVLDYAGAPAHPFGTTLRRGEDQVQPCAQAVIVLKWTGANSYYVLTAYPECRS
jgi:hypothetical protein